MNSFEVIIGLEVHIELATKSKMFCSCSADYFQADPNTHTCPVCLGLPGAMPVANKEAIKYAQLFGLALSCTNPLGSKFDRKNYFYPDLPKGFQISQYDLPFSQKGKMKIYFNGQEKTIGITRAHLEEDTGKLAHVTKGGKNVTLIDYNRSSVPLLEIVSDPEMRGAEEAKTYAQKLQQIARYLKVSDADMEKGSMRIEPNVSLRKKGEKSLPKYKVELKNINSFRFAEKAINYEINRQSEILDKGEIPIQETRGWDENINQTVSQRSKEEAHDYRYFPEPDIPPFEFTAKYIQELKASLPELIDEKLARYTKEYSLSFYDAKILSRDRKIAEFFDEAVKVGKGHNVKPKQIANIIINKKPNLDTILPAELVKGIVTNLQTISTPSEEIDKIIEDIIAKNQKAVADYKAGKENSLMFLLGQVMRKLAGKIDAQTAKSKLLEKING